MAAAPLQVSMNRLKAVCDEWARLSGPTAAADENALSITEDGTSTPINAIAMACAGADKLAANQRAVSLLQFLCKSQQVPTNCAFVLSRPSAAAPITAYTATILSSDTAVSKMEDIPAPAATTTAEGAAAAPSPSSLAPQLIIVKDLPALFGPLTESAAAAAAAGTTTAVGILENEISFHSVDSPFVQSFEASVKALPSSSSSSLRLAKSLKLWTALLVPKYDADTTLAVRRAAAMYSAALKAYIVPTLDAVAAGSTSSPAPSLAKMRAECQNYLNAANTMPGFEKLADWRSFSAAVEPQVFAAKNGAFLPIISSAPNAESDAETLNINMVAVVARMAVRHREQCVVGARTYFFKETAPSSAANALTFAAAAQSCVWTAINAAATIAAANNNNNSGGRTVADVAAEALKSIEALPSASTFLPYLVKDFGSIVGPVLTDKRSVLAPSSSSGQGNTLIVRPNTSYYVRIVLKDIPFNNSDTSASSSSSSAAATSYSVEIGDTVIAGMAEDFPRRAPRTFPAVLMLPDGDPDRPTHTDGDGGANTNNNNEAAAGARRAVTRMQANGTISSLSAEEARIAKQSKLWEEKEREFGSAGPKPKNDDPANELSTCGRLASGNAVSYSNRAAISSSGVSPSTERLVASASALTVWLPIGGRPVPFHMAAIKDVAVRAEGAGVFTCTVSFHSTQESYIAFRGNRTKIFLREATFRATESAMFDAVRNAVIIGHENIKDADKRRQAEKGLVPSAGLNIRSGATLGKLPNVFIRPQVYAKVANRGTLEATEKGFRFDFSGGGLTPIEVSYDNVKCCICQPANNDTQVLFHVVLFKPMQWGKEKTGVKEFQVAAVVLEASEALSGRRKMSEAEELEQEERERQRVAATNKEFIDFTRLLNNGKVKNVFAPNKSYDIDGSMGKGNVRIRGSAKALWQINETPFQTVVFSDIEIAILERMIVGGKTFDLVLVPKNYRDKLVTISSIPMKKADEVKTWLCGGDVVYIEIGTNQNYPRLFKQFESDLEWNPWDKQGWRAMVEDGSDEEGEEGSEEDDSSWGGSSEEDDEGDDSDDSYSGSEGDDSDEDFGDSSSGASGGGGAGAGKKRKKRGSDDSDGEDSSAEDWSDMERRAEEEDAEDDSEDDSEDERPARKRGPRTGNAPPAAGGGRGGGGMFGRGGAPALGRGLGRR